MDPSELIDKNIQDLGDWRGELISKLRRIIHEAVPEIKEEWKWTTPIYTLNGMVCATGSFSDHVKINFFKGSSLHDTHKVFNNGLDSKSHRSIDFFKGDSINESAVKDLIQQAVKLNNKK